MELIKVSTPHKFVNVTTGENVLLQCTFVTIAQTSDLNIQWDFVSKSDITPQQVDTHAQSSEAPLMCSDFDFKLSTITSWIRI